MGSLKWRDLPIQKFFMALILLVFSIVVLFSGLIVWGCAAFRHYLLPDSNSAYLTIQTTFTDGTTQRSSWLFSFGSDPKSIPQMEEIHDGISAQKEASVSEYSIEKLENSFDMLTPKRQLAYTACGILMIAAPMFLSLAGILFCSLYFYRKKLRLPLKLLSEATGQIAAQNLDFDLEYDCRDEMGDLCRSFSQMKNALYENNKRLWSALEERKRLQASVAHDLRNPIAIIQGYTEYLEDKAAAGELTPERALRIAQNMNLAAKRLGRYTDSIHTLNQLEDIAVKKETVCLSRLAEDLTADFSLIAQNNGRTLHVSSDWADAFTEKGFSIEKDLSILADTAILYRVLENIIGNSLRFSQKDIFMDISLETGPPSPSSRMLTITVRDDGKGFPAQMLENASSPCLPHASQASGPDGHMGMGMAISRILCQKHGGTLSLSNGSSGGAQVKISFQV
ncbi:MAG: HAMP domain-containing histidine kinase [Acetatifactor sp.]|nr:HAMP domain-containing histidine kinase [Acetatifactor sp.]